MKARVFQSSTPPSPAARSSRSPQAGEVDTDALTDCRICLAASATVAPVCSPRYESSRLLCLRVSIELRADGLESTAGIKLWVPSGLGECGKQLPRLSGVHSVTALSRNCLSRSSSYCVHLWLTYAAGVRTPYDSICFLSSNFGNVENYALPMVRLMTHDEKASFANAGLGQT